MDEQLQKLKEKMLPVMQDIQPRLTAVESRPAEQPQSNATFSEENPQLPINTLIERIQVLEAGKNLEPALSTLHSSISSGPLEPTEGVRKHEGQGSLIPVEGQPMQETNASTKN